jgi:UTP:GlnB (protein PII) uridylyltransferase
VIRSAHIATHGERAVDVFYLTGADGAKIEGAASLRRLEAALYKAASGAAPQGRKAA